VSSTADRQALPRPEPAPPRPEPAQRRREALRLSVRDMVASMVVIAALVVAMVALVPRPNAQPIRRVDVAATAQRAADRLTFVPAVPQGLPDGWVPTSADVRDSGDGITTWHIGYLTADGHNASVEQAAKVTPQWISIMDSGGVARPSQQIDGTSWVQHYKDVREVTALIHRTDGWTTMVTSKGGGLRNAQVLAEAIPASQR